MELISVIIHAYTYLLFYEMLEEEEYGHSRYLFVMMFALIKYARKVIPYTKHLQPLMLCTLLILYSVFNHSKNSNLKNMGYSLITYGIDYVSNILLGSISGIIGGIIKVTKHENSYFISIIIRIIFVILLFRFQKKNVFMKLKRAGVFFIAEIAAIVILFLDQILCLSYSMENFSFGYVAVACIYMAVLFTTLWLIDHYKMVKIQKMYADDNKQMSQKLHRSKEILPMIANYVSTMDGTQDEGMRKKLEEVCHDYGKELGGAEMCAEFIETTGIDLVNLLLRTKIMECSEQDIELNVFVSTQIAEDMKQMDISDGEITRLLGDLLRNAINAVSNLQDKMILLLIARDENDRVLIRIYDSGIPFPPYVLERFGERGNTTWGTGNGIADMMETLHRVQASIEINMNMEPGDVFTKGIFICFDGEDQVNIINREEYPDGADVEVCLSENS